VYQGWDYVSHGFIPGLDVSVCSLLDPDCARPLASGRTDATGTAVMRLQNAPDAFGLGLNGYFEVTSPDMSYVPNIVYWGYPLSEANAPSPAGGGPNWNVTPAEYQGLAAFLGVTLDPKRGTIVAVVVDCLLDNAPGVQVSLDVRDQAIGEFYGFNNPKATATDQTGLAIFTNVPAGTVHLTATPLAIRKPSSHVAVQVRAGWITGPTLLPTP
jgi:hypothetical protein